MAPQKLLVMPVLLFCLASAAVMAEENAPAAVNEKMSPCQGLKPFNNLDELLYQFYINLDNDCLFEMPAAELEKIWEVKILAEDQANNKEFATLWNSVDFYLKPYKSEKDAFYVEIKRAFKKNIRREFLIKITKAYYEEHATLFPDGNYPKLLPPPLKRLELSTVLNSLSPKPRYPKIKGVYGESRITYYWLSDDKRREIFMGGYAHAVLHIEIVRQLNLGLPSAKAE